MSNSRVIKLERFARYQRLRTLALRLLFTTTPLAVLGGLWYWLSPATFAAIQLPWSIVTAVLVTVLVVVEFLKWPLPKYLVVLASDGADELLLKTKSVAEARSFLADYVKAHNIDEANVSDVTLGKRG